MYRIKQIVLSVFTIGLALYFVLPTLAAVTNTPVFVQTPNLGSQTFIAGTDATGTYKTVYTGGANGSKCTALMAASSDNSNSHLLTVEVIHSATTTPIATVTIPVSGTAHTYGTTLNMMSYINWPGLPVDSDGNPFLFLATSDTLKVNYLTAINASGGNDQINVLSVCADF